NPGDQGDASLTTLSDGRVVVFHNETGDSTNTNELDSVILDPREKAINGTSGNDTIVGRLDGSSISGLAGNDHLTGMGANDTLNGGPGDDVPNGGAGIDTASYAGATAGVNVSLALTSPQNTGGAGIDTLS